MFLSPSPPSSRIAAIGEGPGGHPCGGGAAGGARPTDVFDVNGCKRLGDKGVTEIQAVPWYFTGKDPDDLQNRLDSLEWWAETVISAV